MLPKGGGRGAGGQHGVAYDAYERDNATREAQQGPLSNLLMTGHKGECLLWFRVLSCIGSRASSWMYQNSRVACCPMSFWIGLWLWRKFWSSKRMANCKRNEQFRKGLFVDAEDNGIEQSSEKKAAQYDEDGVEEEFVQRDYEPLRVVRRACFNP
ncbi:hypothetical protein RHSIM_Rhsim11G0166000 [Rhododendron simsii]|uniref:Uncharacterized protein n=1 Tax=Rhododendron simsii TaxID=118357 RepID=A0A834GC32_RHOSS|nr:hypothetical protein RHSIM_Rhsim11G0166000 [Rhododendron simsii]